MAKGEKMGCGAAMTPRPTLTDPAVRRAAVEAIWPGVKAWLESRVEHETGEIALADLVRATTYPDNGYILARRLEIDAGWEPDDDLVDVLRGYGSAFVRAFDAAVRAWEAEHGSDGDAS